MPHDCRAPAPQVPYLVWAARFTAMITLINVRGIQVTARANTVMMIIMSGCAILFIGFAARNVVRHGPGALFSTLAFSPGDVRDLPPLMLGAGIATLSYIGFDAISTLAEDTLSPERESPFPPFSCAFYPDRILLLTVYLAALVWPDYKAIRKAKP